MYLAITKITIINEVFIMYNDQGIQQDSGSWIFFVKACFVCAIGALGGGIFMMPADKLDPVDASQCDRIRIKTDPVCWQISYKPFNPF